MSRTFDQTGALSRGRVTGCDPVDIAVAAAVLRAGDVIGLPTETVYGLAADATQGEAVARIYEAKGRPSFNPLISHVANLEEAKRHGVFDNRALQLAEAFWPGPLTLVLPFHATSPVSDLARAGLDTIALRVPAHPVARALIEAVGRPLAAPSANLSGRVSPTTAADVAADLGGRVALVVDGGPSEVGLESTILGCFDGKVFQLRPGGVSREAAEAVLGLKLHAAPSSERLLAPGLLESHYAPIAPVHMNVINFRPNDAILAFGDTKLPEFVGSRPVINLSPSANLRQAAARLFSALRDLDAHQPAAIAVAPIPGDGLGEAINDRLKRASAPRG
jgi:L-threonylcarbamoyladenylate synthase